MKVDPPLVSILIPVRDGERWIRCCVESALAQDWPRVEVMVCDDGSKDRTGEILASFGERIRVIQGWGEGGNRARNRLLQEASGSWVQNLDGDDALEPWKVRRQLEEAGGPGECDVLYSPTVDQVWKEGDLLKAEVSVVDPSLDPVSQWFLWQLSQANGSLWRTEALRGIGGWAEGQPCCQDNELYGRALRAGLRFGFRPSAGAIYRMWSDRTVSRRDPVLVLKTRASLMETMVRWLEQTGEWTPARKRSAGRAFLEVCRQWWLHDPVGARELFRKVEELGWLAYEGPACPPLYELACRWLGFEAAERMAAWRRGLG